MHFKTLMFFIFISSTVSASSLCNYSTSYVNSIVNTLDVSKLSMNDDFDSQVMEIIYMRGVMLSSFDCPACDKSLSEKKLEDLLLFSKVTNINGYSDWNEYFESNISKIKRLVLKNSSRLKKENKKVLSRNKERVQKVINYDDRLIKDYSQLMFSQLMREMKLFNMPFDISIINRDTGKLETAILLKVSKVWAGYSLDIILNGKEQTINTDSSYNYIPVAFGLESYFKNLKKVETKCQKSNLHSSLYAEVHRRRSVYDSLAENWETKSDKILRNILLYAPRLVIDNLKTIVNGATSKRIQSLGSAIVSYAQEDTHLGTQLLGASVLNPLGTVNALASDVGSIIFSPINAASKKSSRVQVCAAPLTSSLAARKGYGTISGSLLLDGIIYTLDPTYHVGFLIDGVRDSNDGGGGGGMIEAGFETGMANCANAPLKEEMPEALFVEKLRCFDSNYHPNYNFALYNCGGYTRDIMNSNGSSMPILPNYGIGQHLKYNVDSDKIYKTKIRCNNNINKLKNLFLSLELGEDVSSEIATSSLRFYEHNLGNDVLNQAIVSAIRGGNKANINELKSRMPSSYRQSKLLLDAIEFENERLEIDKNSSVSVATSYVSYYELLNSEQMNQLERDFPINYELLNYANSLL